MIHPLQQVILNGYGYILFLTGALLSFSIRCTPAGTYADSAHLP